VARFRLRAPVLTGHLLTEEDEVKEGAIEPDKKPEEVRQEPVELHKDFRWVTVNLSDPKEVCTGSYRTCTFEAHP
jgi:hypothetical protein